MSAWGWQQGEIRSLKRGQTEGEISFLSHQQRWCTKVRHGEIENFSKRKSRAHFCIHLLFMSANLLFGKMKMYETRHEIRENSRARTAQRVNYSRNANYH